MKPSNPIPPIVLTAAATVLQPYLPGLSPEILLDAIQTTSTKDIDKTEKPFTRRECAELLGVSVHSVNRYIRAGYLKAVKISPRLIRITPERVRNLMAHRVPQAGEAEK